VMFKIVRKQVLRQAPVGPTLLVEDGPGTWKAPKSLWLLPSTVAIAGCNAAAPCTRIRWYLTLWNGNRYFLIVSLAIGVNEQSEDHLIFWSHNLRSWHLYHVLHFIQVPYMINIIEYTIYDESIYETAILYTFSCAWTCGPIFKLLLNWLALIPNKMEDE
jgi:hypothetical protein